MSEDRRGRCYELAAEHVIEHGEHDPRMRLCHGWPVLTAGEHEGQRYGHAWVERTTDVRVPYEGQIMKVQVTECLDTVTETWLPLVLYYRAGTIDPDHVSRYDWEQAVEQLQTQDLYGPWVEPYKDAAPFANDA